MKRQQNLLLITLTPHDNRKLATLCGQYNTHLAIIEDLFKVKIQNRGNQFQIQGGKIATEKAARALEKLFVATEKSPNLTKEEVHLILKTIITTSANGKTDQDLENTFIRTKQLTIKPRSPNQLTYLKNIQNLNLNFGIGPAGTGKTYLAVAAAVQALEKEEVSRIILVRPAIEAGERLGFLPGDIAQKVDPYLRPLYDALYEMLGINQVEKLIERSIIEIAPLAFMRGRTLNNAFIILDESQNTTVEQMKMLLTRIGFGSKAVVTGDITQIDLAKGVTSGLKNAMEVLKNTSDIGFCFFDAKDVIRHPLVQKVIRAYQRYETKT